MALHVSQSAKLSVRGLQKQLYAARVDADISREDLAADLGVKPRTLRDWEKGYVVPSLTNATNWAHRLEHRFLLTDRLGAEMVFPPDVDPGPWGLMRLLAPFLKARRRERRISQPDLGLIVGVSRCSLQRWEDGVELPRLTALVVWADRLDFNLVLAPRA
jgi:DNA-binding XRE family transcriptional regulator